MSAGHRGRPGALVAIACVAVVLAACGGGETVKPGTAATAQPAAPDGADPGAGGAAGPPAGEERTSVAPLASRRIRVYFPSVYFDGLAAEEREIFETASPGDRAKQILVDLLAGPDEPTSLPAVPAGVRLRQVYWMDNGTAWADFTGELARGTRGGSMEEILTVYAIVNSLALNVPEIKRVGILVDGKEIDTLSGHVDLRLPLLPDRRLFRRPAESGSGPRADGIPSAAPPQTASAL